MNLRQIHIKHRFYLQIIYFVIYLLLVVLTSKILHKKYRETKTAVKEIHTIQNQINNSYNNFTRFLNLLQPNDAFYHSSNEYLATAKSTLNAINDTLYSLASRNSFAKNLREKGLNDTLLLSTSKVLKTLTLIEHTYKAVGNVHNGKVKNALNYHEQMRAVLSPYISGSIATILADVKSIESEFLFEKNNMRLREINDQISRLQNDSAFSMLDYFIQGEVLSIMNNYISELSQINKARELLGNNTERTGLLYDIERAYTEAYHSFDNYFAEIKNIQQRNLKILLIAGITFIALLSALYLILLVRFYWSLEKPLQALSEFTYKLAKGQHNKKINITSIPGDIVELFQNIQLVTKTVQEKKNFVDNLLKQNFTIDLALQGKHDQFGKTLLALKESMRKAREEELRYSEENRIRQYQNEGIAKFAEILRSNNDNLSKLSDTFIKEIVRYLDAIQGGLFLLENEDDDHLYLASAFAYNRKKYLSKEVKIGVSLVGTCARERKTTNLDSIPDKYIEITSGLGDSPPNNLLLVPVMHDNILIGVLEIASLKPFSKNQITLTEKVCESLASTIINARINTRTNELLEKSQQQAAEMAEQEEEMRQNMEELQATQEESQRREEELEGFLEAIDQTFYVLEYDTDGTITKVNQRFLYLTNLEINQVVGKKHNELFGKDSKADSGFFAHVSGGNIVDLIEQVKIKSKKIEIKNTFTPIKDRNGETTKILNIMTMIV